MRQRNAALRRSTQYDVSHCEINWEPHDLERERNVRPRRHQVVTQRSDLRFGGAVAMGGL